MIVLLEKNLSGFYYLFIDIVKVSWHFIILRAGDQTLKLREKLIFNLPRNRHVKILSSETSIDGLAPWEWEYINDTSNSSSSSQKICDGLAWKITVFSFGRFWSSASIPKRHADIVCPKAQPETDSRRRDSSKIDGSSRRGLNDLVLCYR